MALGDAGNGVPGGAPDVEVKRRMRSSTETVYGLVSDVTRMGDWSPETTSCRWVGGARGPVVGAKFRGTNRFRWMRWTTTCTVVAADAGKRFAFDVAEGPIPVSRWSFDFVPETGSGAAGGDEGGHGAGEAAGEPLCTVTESWTDARPRWFARIVGTAMGIPNRAAHNRRTMEATLDALAAASEVAASARPTEAT
jgi:hypothetical protein